MNITRWRRAEINGSNDSGDQNGYKGIQMLPRSSKIEWFQGMRSNGSKGHRTLSATKEVPPSRIRTCHPACQRLSHKMC